MGRGVHVTGAMTDGAARLVGEALRLVGKMEVFADARSVAKGTGTIGLRRIGSGGAAEVAVARTIEGDEAT